MGKRVDHDATQEVSASMLVPPAKPPALGNMPKNDASMWMSAPVSADDFVGAAKKKPAAPRGRALVIGATLVGLLGVGGAGTYYAFLRESPAQTSPSAPPPTPAQPAAATIDAAVAEAPAEDAAAAAVAAPADAGTGVAATAGALQVDAVSAADPAVKKTTKKRPAKKKVVKKKTATKRR